MFFSGVQGAAGGEDLPAEHSGWSAMVHQEFKLVEVEWIRQLVVFSGWQIGSE